MLILCTQSGTMNIFILNMNEKQASKKKRGESQSSSRKRMQKFNQGEIVLLQACNGITF